MSPAKTYLLEESHQSAGSPLIKLGQVDIFQIQNESFTVFWSVYAARVCTDDHAGLAQLLQKMPRSSLRTAVDRGDLCGAELGEGIPEKHPARDRRHCVRSHWEGVSNKTLLTRNVELLSFF